jgi:prepilin peptidase CpaA
MALVLVTAAAGYDLKSHRIPNALTYPSWIAGLAVGALAAGWAGLGNAALGFAAGFLPMFLLFASGTLGGGDVKLMGGVGALLGFPSGLNALISAVLVGGFLAALILLWQGRLFPMIRYAGASMRRVFDKDYPVQAPPERKDAFPFGVAIALGTYLTVASISAGRNSPANLLPAEFFGM